MISTRSKEGAEARYVADGRYEYQAQESDCLKFGCNAEELARRRSCSKRFSQRVIPFNYHKWQRQGEVASGVSCVNFEGFLSKQVYLVDRTAPIW